MNEQESIRAAGGLLWRQSARGRELAVIRRERHGTEWTLPKGKAGDDESWTQAARREVKEETGCTVELGGFAGANAYLVGDRPKVVLFWHMTLLELGKPEDKAEVMEIAWLLVPEALARLTHDNEKRLLLTSGAAMAHALSELPSRAFSFTTMWRRLQVPESARRLAESLPCYRTELDRLIQRAITQPQPATDLTWACTATALLAQAEAALAQHDEERGWRFFLAAQRMELRGLALVDPDALRLRGQTIFQEALDKLRSWRRERVQILMTEKSAVPPPQPSDGATAPASGGATKSVSAASNVAVSVATSTAAGSPPSLEAIIEASQILHEHYSNEGVKRRTASRQTLIMTMIAFAAVLLWFVVLWLNSVDGECCCSAGEGLSFYLKTPPPLTSISFNFAVVVCGLLGAAFSGMLSLANDPRTAKIPDLYFSFRITLARFVVAVLSALAVHLLLATKFLQFDQLDPTGGVILVAAVAAGFSERLVVSGLNKLPLCKS